METFGTLIMLLGGAFLLAFGLAILAILGAWYGTLAAMALSWFKRQVTTRAPECDEPLELLLSTQ